MNGPGRLATVALTVALAVGVAACGSGEDETDSGGDFSATVRIEGSSTVAPLSEAVAERFQAENPDIRVTVGTSGGGDGFEKVRVSTDALTVVINPDNPVGCFTTNQLRDVWGPESTISNWNDIPGLEGEAEDGYDEELGLFAPGTDSDAFDFFTEEINYEEGVLRKGYNDVGEDVNAIVDGVAGDPGGMGFVGFSYFAENEDSLKALEIDGGTGCTAPSVETAQNDEYEPLGRPLFIYFSRKAPQEKAVKAFVDYYLENVDEIAESVGFIPLTAGQLAASRKAVAALD